MSLDEDQNTPHHKKKRGDEAGVLDPTAAVTKAYENDPDFKELLDQYSATKPKALADPTTDPIPEPLTKILESWFGGHYSSTEIKKMSRQKLVAPPMLMLLFPCK